jgi:hypothetical protein
MSQQAQEQQIGLRLFFKDLAAGTVSGSVGLAIGQPFDVVKVRLQHSAQWNGPLSCAVGTIKTEGVAGRVASRIQTYTQFQVWGRRGGG